SSMLKIFVVFLLTAALSVVARSAAAGVPTEQIKTTVEKALVVLKDPQLKTPAKMSERRDQLKQILFARFDFTEMARRALGANWRRRTPQEQEEFVRLFTEVLERAYAGIIESYSDEKIFYTNERIDGSFADVGSKIVTSKGEEYSINYKAHLVSNEWKVYDVVAENISLVNNYRSQFTRVIAHESYDELVRRLKNKADFDAPKKQ
ncbi:MAG TPA: ABC transporter substrate-binding protein, partial [Candidatus Eisenbacteria bacterium]|nr:ABC transporter substrate-binding protein [Candidatus Eisenbacteria bacterium]